MDEAMLNHNEIFVHLYNGNINGAIEAFSEKTKKITFSPFVRTMYLTSLNMGIYSYILIKENISLHSCCIENERKISQCTNNSILETGANIITSYGLDRNYLSEKYQNIYIRNATSYIHKHLSESLTLERVGEEINMNPSYLCQLFKQEVKMSFSYYIFKQRMKLAEQLLKKTSCSIQEIALKCGFRNTSYFSTCYKKFSGKQPSQVRLEDKYSTLCH